MGQVKLKVNSGLSLLELITVLGIFLVLTVFALPSMEVAFVRTQEKLLHERLSLIRQGIDKYVASRNSSGATYFPPCLASLTEPIPDSLLIVGANPGPFLTIDSLGNPMFEKGDLPAWDIRDKDGVTHSMITDLKQQIQIYDVRFPLAGINGWIKAGDGTFYADW
ncbi:MAG: hypothetical protein AB1403_21735 [Candidatus Riflebacteria bacterium]